MCPLARAKIDSLWASTDEVELGLADRPRLAREARVLDHGPVLEQLGEIARRRRRPRARAAPRRARRGRPRRRSRSRRRARRRRRRARPRTPRASSGAAPSARAPARKVSGAGFPCRCSRSATTPSIRASKKSSIPAAASTSRQLVLDDTTARRSPASRAASQIAHRALVRLDAVARGSSAGRSRSCDCPARARLGARADRRLALGQLDPARRQERPHAVVARLAVDVLAVVGDRDRRARTPRPVAPPARAGRRRTSPSTPRRAPSPSSSAPRRGRRGRPARRPEGRAPLLALQSLREPVHAALARRAGRAGPVGRRDRAGASLPRRAASRCP